MRLIGAQRDRAATYLVITIAAFAVTVAATRWYLDLAGYPTVGGGELHVAHVLWGGLALFVATLLPLLFVGRRSLLLSALLAGVGVGLFIDEVGKFLTTSNDYFFAPAAPIIYGSILLLVLLALFVRRRGLREDDITHAVLSALGDAVDERLTQAERERVIEMANGAGSSTDPLGLQLVATLDSGAIDERLAREGPIARGDARRWLEGVLPTRVERWLVYLGLVLTIMGAVGAGLSLLALQILPEDPDLSALVAGHVEIPSDPLWLGLLFAINVAVGTLAVVALGLRLFRSNAWLNAALLAVLIDLVVGELVAVYAIQIAALSAAVWGVILLGLVLDLRIRTAHEAVDDAQPRS